MGTGQIGGSASVAVIKESGLLGHSKTLLVAMTRLLAIVTVIVTKELGALELLRTVSSSSASSFGLRLNGALRL